MTYSVQAKSASAGFTHLLGVLSALRSPQWQYRSAMYQGVGVPTPRGTGTSGHVQSNVFTATQSRLERNRANQPARGASAQRHQQQNHQPSSAILAHNRKRALENLRLHLEELGHSPDEIKRQLSIEHERLATGKTRSMSNSDSHQPHPDSHTNAARKQHELDTVGRALDLDSSSAREGDAFDSEKQAHAKAEQAHAKLEEIKERERRREEAKRQKAEKMKQKQQRREQEDQQAQEREYSQHISSRADEKQSRSTERAQCAKTNHEERDDDRKRPGAGKGVDGRAAETSQARARDDNRSTANGKRKRDEQQRKERSEGVSEEDGEVEQQPTVMSVVHVPNQGEMLKNSNAADNQRKRKSEKRNDERNRTPKSSSAYESDSAPGSRSYSYSSRSRSRSR